MEAGEWRLEARGWRLEAQGRRLAQDNPRTIPECPQHDAKDSRIIPERLQNDTRTIKNGSQNELRRHPPSNNSPTDLRMSS